MRLRVIKHLLTATVLLKSFAKLAVAALDHSGDVVKRYDYEPGDELNRTMCFCTSDPSLQQTDNDPFAFFNTTVDHHMMYVFEFAYYNHRLGKTMRVISNDTTSTCPTKDSPEDPYYHNACLEWEDLDKDFCADFVLTDLPEGVEKKNWWTFCYLFRGDVLDDPNKRDFFTLDKAKRAIPRQRDWIEPIKKVNAHCEGMCRDRGLKLFRSRYGGWFSRMDGFHHFDDICTDVMDCSSGPGHYQPPARERYDMVAE